MNGIFRYCKSLNTLLDISKWNIVNVISFYTLFFKCFLLKYSKWKINNVIDISEIFIIVHLYYFYQIFQNGKQKMLKK